MGPLIMDLESAQADVDRLRKDTRTVNLAITCQESSGNAVSAKTVATCLHMFVPKAIDITSGELFEYMYLYILQNKFPKAKYIAHNTICRYWQWSEKLDGTAAGRRTAMHEIWMADDC